MLRLDPPAVKSMQPSVGPLCGGTVVTITFDRLPLDDDVHMQCAFGSRLVDAVLHAQSRASVTCAAPPAAAPGLVQVALTLGGRDIGTVLPYTYHGSPRVTAVRLRAEQVNGAGRILVEGQMLDDVKACHYLFANISVTTSSATASSLECPIPQLPGGIDYVTVTRNGQDYSEATAASLVASLPGNDTVKFWPRQGSVHGGTPLSVVGLESESQVVCQFKSAEPGQAVVRTVFATRTAAGALRCLTPEVEQPTTHNVLLWVGASAARDWPAGFVSAGTWQYYYVPADEVASVAPLNGPSSGGTLVLLEWTRHSAELAYRMCKFGEVLVPASPERSDKALWSCRSPAGPAGRGR